MADIFLYPGEANPNDVKLRDPTIPDITIDKWYKQEDNPIRKIALTAALAGSFFFVDAPAEVITVDKWIQPTNQPQSKSKSRLQGGETRTDVVVAAEIVTLDKWYQIPNQPFFRKRDSNTGEYRFEVPRDILTSDWFQATNEPVKQKVRQLFSGESRVEVVVPAEVITIDKWHQPVNQPVFKRFNQINSGEFRVEVVVLPPVPPDPLPLIVAPEEIIRRDHGGGGEEEHQRRVDILREDEEVLNLIKMWLERL